jgi:vacuole morphology and inheritance protein 14
MAARATGETITAAGAGGLSGPVSDFPLPPSVLKNLSDRAFEKRRVGAQEVEKIVRRLRETNSNDAIRRVLQVLASEFACNVNSNNRKGGLIGLASCAIGLTTQISDHLDLVVLPVLKNFTDQEPRVRYYACESLFNIVKICRGAILLYFNDVFVGVCRLIADLDAEVKNGAALFDRLLREIVMEAAASVGPSGASAADSGSDVARRVVPLLRAHMGVFNPYVRQLLVGWISALDSVPGVDMLDHLGELLEGLFDMLSDGNREVRLRRGFVLHCGADIILTPPLLPLRIFERCGTLLIQRCLVFWLRLRAWQGKSL